MRSVLAALVLFAITTTISPSPALAQDWSQPWADPEDRPPRIDFSVSGGLLLPTRWSDVALLGSFSPAQGALEQVLTRDVHVKPNAQYIAAATYWRSRYGFRARGGFSRSTLKVGDAGVGAAPSSVGIDTWLYDIGGAIGFVEYSPSRGVWPYGFLGFGGITYDLKETVPPPLTFVARGPSGSGANTTVVVGNPPQVLLTTNALSTETVFAMNIGIGTDVRVPLQKGAVALRLELGDHIAPSPIGFRVEQLSPFITPAADTGVRHRFVHHLSATAGLVVQVGR